MVRRNDDAELLAMCDVKPEDQLNLVGDVPFFNTMEEMFAAIPEIEIVNICTPNGYHSQQAVKALEHGKHVVVEKPMGLNTENCRQVIKTADENDKLVFCVMQNRHSPPSKWLKSLVDEGHLGQLYMMHLNCFWNRDDR